MNLRGFFVAMLLVLALQPIYLAALMAIDYVAPADRRAAHLVAAFDAGELDPEDKVVPPYNRGNDWDVECVALSIGLAPGASPLHNAVAAARPLPGDPTVCAALANAAARAPGVTWMPYFRYWHGYRIALNPLVAWLPIKAVRLLMLVCLTAALTFLSAEATWLVGRPAALALVAPIVVMTDIWYMWITTADSLSTIFILAGAAWFARRIRHGSGDGALIAAAAVLGSMFNYIDFLLNPPWQPMLLAFLVLAAPPREHGGDRLRKCVSVLAAWSFGYALTWASRWVIAAAILPQGLAVLRDIIEVARYRIDGDEAQLVSHRLLAPSAKALAVVVWQIWHTDWAAMLAMLTPALLPARAVAPGRFAVLAAPAVIPFAWFELMSNHTQIHATIVCRPIASSVGILLAAWILADRTPRFGEAVGTA
jgi:hypothetical protein